MSRLLSASAAIFRARVIFSAFTLFSSVTMQEVERLVVCGAPCFQRCR